MNDCRVEFLERKVISRATGQKRLCRERLCDRHGLELRLPEASARALAASMAREKQSGARVIGPDRVDVAWFFWVGEAGRVVEAPPGSDGETVLRAARKEATCRD